MAKTQNRGYRMMRKNRKVNWFQSTVREFEFTEEQDSLSQFRRYDENAWFAKYSSSRRNEYRQRWCITGLS